MQPKIWLSSPHMGGNESKFVNEAFDSNWVAPLGPNVNGLEKDIARFLLPENENNIHVAALSSGTAAIHLGLILLGIKAGDEVICQSMTFSASANPIAYQGATPVFIDSESDTWNMSPQFLEKAIKDRIAKGRKPKAIIPVHLYGMPAKMDEIMAIANQYEIPVLEDAAEALGSHINGKMCGTYGVIAALSFNGNKIITTSGGGAMVAHQPELAEKARFLSTQARDPAPHYLHSHIGYNYRMSNICAGIGRGQMEVLPQRVLQRRANFEWYGKVLNDTDAIQLLKEPDGYYSNHWLTTVLIKHPVITRETIRLALDKVNIESRPLWKPMHCQPVFKDAPFYGDGTAEKLFENGLCLPSGSNLTDEERNRILTAIRAVFS
ncbi:DegT/DnrJ/EryC1/StrS family aminotransferase [Agriterribacter sp.]|uniref:DegT/DnrJ/EryC1/StrS family aminotransferase n=1 Tax=Agriterribacter sp. TaxID=2821509 RepID=UPI002BD9A0FB|nr:aminotransferase class I/II-fold pyridoxal phosphate-dependent enzyme [Agriterribacter sp.]HTN07275.1 aminotransferase class I/II-fold pyridoxal phosphate-dependent enzyme [Agriterribacter sp.]